VRQLQLRLPHSVIRLRYYDEAELDGAPEGFRSAPLAAVGLPEIRYTLQVYLEDCTGCGLCVEACPAVTPGDPITKAINLGALEPLVAAERDNIAFFATLPATDRSGVDFGTVRGTQFLEPLFEFSGACAGCGETPYVKPLSQLFGDRMMVANATGCSSSRPIAVRRSVASTHLHTAARDRRSRGRRRSARRRPTAWRGSRGNPRQAVRAGCIRRGRRSPGSSAS
jgi:ferredoxin